VSFFSVKARNGTPVWTTQGRRKYVKWRAVSAPAVTASARFVTSAEQDGLSICGTLLAHRACAAVPLSFALPYAPEKKTKKQSKGSFERRCDGGFEVISCYDWDSEGKRIRASVSSVLHD